MKRIVLATIILAILVTPFIVSIVEAISPSATVTLQEDSTAKLDWDISGAGILGITDNVVKRSTTDYPLSRTDANDTLIYSGANITYTDDISGYILDANVNSVPMVIYYSIWTEYRLGNYDGGYITVAFGTFSPICSAVGTAQEANIWSDVENVSLDVGGEDMPIAIMFIGFIILALVPTVAAFALKSGRTILAIVAAGTWLLLGIYSYTQSQQTWDIYYAVFWLSMGMVFVCPFMAVLLREKKEDIAIEDDDEDTALLDDIEAGEKDRTRIDRMFGRTRRKRSSKMSTFAKMGKEKKK